jgi:hypothetical protein
MPSARRSRDRPAARGSDGEEIHEEGFDMTALRKTRTALVAAASLAVVMAAVPTEASAQWRRGGGVHHGGGWAGGGWRGGGWRGGGWNRGGAAAAGVIGGLALGALAAGAYAPRPYYAAPAYPVYDEGYCQLRNQRYWNGYRWRVRRVEVCD